MTQEDMKAELERRPFIPLRLHLVSGKTVDATMESAVFLLQNAVMAFHDPTGKGVDEGFDVIALRNIERIEQLTARDRHEVTK